MSMKCSMYFHLLKNKYDCLLITFINKFNVFIRLSGFLIDKYVEQYYLYGMKLSIILFMIDYEVGA